jgi:peroxiredoxin
MKRFVLISTLLFASCVVGLANDNEFVGAFDPHLVAELDDLEQVIFKPAVDLSKLKLSGPVEKGAEVTLGWLFDVRRDKPAIQTLLVEPKKEAPYLLADLDLNGAVDANERFGLKASADGNPYEWDATIALPIAGGGPFTTAPLYVRYLRNVRWAEMRQGERMLLESRTVNARGAVDLRGRKTLVQYSFDLQNKKVDFVTGTFAVDVDGDGKLDLDRFSAEAADARAGAAIFRVGDLYVSTKRADVEKNQITMRSHSASDYKRIPLSVGTEMPDFQFTDFDGKKRRFSEYRGKYVLVDFWGMWCPPCREELPYLREAHRRFQARGFEIVGMNTDESGIVPQVKAALNKNGMTWVQARRESIQNLIEALRISSYPTTVLIGPDGKVLSLNNTRKGQPSLRGKELLESLEEVIGQ